MITNKSHKISWSTHRLHVHIEAFVMKPSSVIYVGKVEMISKKKVNIAFALIKINDMAIIKIS